jgi:hypothetical protein
VTSTINSSIGDVKSVWADRHSPAVASFHQNTNLLKAEGFIVDTIDGMAACIEDYESKLSNARIGNRLYSRLHQSASHSNPYSGWGATDAIWHALVANLTTPGQYTEARRLFFRQCRSASSITTPLVNPFTFTNWYRLNKGLVVAGRTVEEWGNDPNSPWADDGLASEGKESDLFHYRLASHWRSRRFITTMKGYAGLSPLTSRPGDKICVILGCCTPIILRKVQGRYELVGECYLHGIMHGEAMVDLDAGKHKLEDFVIL